MNENARKLALGLAHGVVAFETEITTELEGEWFDYLLLDEDLLDLLSLARQLIAELEGDGEQGEQG